MNPNIPVSEVMTKNVISIHVEDSFNIVSKTFENHSFHHIPILDRGKLVGILSKEDILRLLSVRTEYSDKEFMLIKVKDFMSNKVTSIRPDDSVGLAADIFMTNDIHALPVVDNDELVGIVTTHDLIKYAYKSPVE
ncbi:MAG TPA: CBS domain-containing protein [Saprospiraceae bacterium]|nr:CBS domain-containing protein [Saprospiraceae bacterium]